MDDNKKPKVETASVTDPPKDENPTASPVTEPTAGTGDAASPEEGTEGQSNGKAKAPKASKAKRTRVPATPADCFATGDVFQIHGRPGLWQLTELSAGSVALILLGPAPRCFRHPAAMNVAADRVRPMHVAECTGQRAFTRVLTGAEHEKLLASETSKRQKVKTSK